MTFFSVIEADYTIITSKYSPDKDKSAYAELRAAMAILLPISKFV